MSKQNRLKHVFWNCGTVDCDKRLVSARGLGVNEAGEDFFARASCRSLDVLCSAQEQGVPFPDTHLNRCFTAIYILQSSLDYETGGELATSLFQVYEYSRLQVLKAFRREPDPELSQARTAIQGILSAWEEIGPRVDGDK